MKRYNDQFLACDEACSRSDYLRMKEIAEPLAAEGVPWAKGVMGSLYECALGGVPRDLEKAKSLYLEAHAEGNELSTSNLVSIYEQLGDIETAQRFKNECIERKIGIYGEHLRDQDEERDSGT